MDLELFERYGLTVTHAHNVVEDQILEVPLAGGLGFVSQWRNAGQLTNNTFEVSLNVPIVTRRNFNYSARVNYDRTTSVISRLDVPTFFFSAAGQQGTEQMFKIVQGGRMGQIYGRKFIKDCNQLPGDFRSRCGAGLDYQRNSDGFVVYTGAGNTVIDGITKSLWTTRIPERRRRGGGPDASRWRGEPSSSVQHRRRAVLPIGKALTKFSSRSANLAYKRVSVYGLPRPSQEGTSGQWSTATSPRKRPVRRASRREPALLFRATTGASAVCRRAEPEQQHEEAKLVKRASGSAIASAIGSRQMERDRSSQHHTFTSTRASTQVGQAVAIRFRRVSRRQLQFRIFAVTLSPHQPSDNGCGDGRRPPC